MRFSVHLWASACGYSSEILTKPPGTLTHPLTLANPASVSTSPSSRLSRPSASSDFYRLPFFCPLVCSVLSAALFTPLLCSVSCCLLSSVFFWSRGKSRAQALCVGFAPKQTKGFLWLAPTPTETNATHCVTAKKKNLCSMVFNLSQLSTTEVLWNEPIKILKTLLLRLFFMHIKLDYFYFSKMTEIYSTLLWTKRQSGTREGLPKF